jgi:hypothetical protein
MTMPDDTSLTPPPLQPLSASGPTATPRNEPILFTDFSYATENLKPVNNAQLTDGLLRMTTNTSNNQRGQGWFARRVKISDGFQMTFRFRITGNTGSGTPGADGLAFVIHNDPNGLTTAGTSGGCIGYGGIRYGIAIEFDTFTNAPSAGCGKNDPANDHIGVMVGSGTDYTLNGEHPSPFDGQTYAGSLFKNGQIHTVRIIYTPGSPGRIDVYFNDNFQPAVTKNISNVATVLNSSDGAAWVGFTSATGLLRSIHDILAWELAVPNLDISPLSASETPPFAAISSVEYRYNSGDSRGYDPEVLDENWLSPNDDGTFKTPAAPFGITLTPGMTKIPVEIWAKVWYPTDLTKGPYPLVVFLHGNHGTCGRYTGNTATPGNRRVDGPPRSYVFFAQCPLLTPTGGGTPVRWVQAPSYLGYDYIAEPLAKAGFIVVSINANLGITGREKPDGLSDPYLIAARGRLVLKHLNLLHTWNQSGNFPFTDSTNRNLLQGKIDFTNVGLVGHSRGGEGIRAAYELYTADTVVTPTWRSRMPNLKIKVLFEIAPTDNRPAPLAPTSVPLSVFTGEGVVRGVLLPSCDGDVASLEGVRPYDRAFASGNETPAAQKFVYVVRGANHNYYNTEWQVPENGWAEGGSHINDSLCPGAEALFDPQRRPTFSPAQLDSARYPIVAIMRAHLGTSSNAKFNLNFNPLNPQYATPLVDLSYSVSPNTTIHTTYLEKFTLLGTIPPSTAVNVAVATVISNDYNAIGVLPHFQPQYLAKLNWTYGATPTPYFQLNFGTTDARKYATLDLRIAIVPPPSSSQQEFNPPWIGFRVNLIDFADNTSSSYYVIYPAKPSATYNSAFSIWHPVLQTIRIPLCYFNDFNLASLKGIRLTFASEAQPIGEPLNDRPEAIYLGGVSLSQFTGASYLGSQCNSGVFGTPLPTHDSGGNNNSNLESAIASLANPASLLQPLATPTIATLTVVPPGEPVIELSIPTGYLFPNLSSREYSLIVGEREFIFYPDVTGNEEVVEGYTWRFRLTSNEFAELKDGVPILAGIRGSLYPFGLLDKSKLGMEVKLRGYYQWVSYIITNHIRPKMTNEVAIGFLEQAVTGISTLLSDLFWLDDMNLNPSQADAFFDLVVLTSENIRQFTKYERITDIRIGNSRLTADNVFAIYNFAIVMIAQEAAYPGYKSDAWITEAGDTSAVDAFSAIWNKCNIQRVPRSGSNGAFACREAWHLAHRIRAEMAAQTTLTPVMTAMPETK